MCCRASGCCVCLFWMAFSMLHCVVSCDLTVSVGKHYVFLQTSRNFHCTVAYSGERCCDAPPPSLWSDWILDNFWTVFVSFVLRLNRKIRVPRLLVTVHVFCLLQTASKCTQTYHFRDKKMIFVSGGTQRLHRTAPHPLDAYSALSHLTEILNTPLSLHIIAVSAVKWTMSDDRVLSLMCCDLESLA